MNVINSTFNLKTLFSFLYISAILSAGLNPITLLAAEEGCYEGDPNCVVIVGVPIDAPPIHRDTIVDLGGGRGGGDTSNPAPPGVVVPPPPPPPPEEEEEEETKEECLVRVDIAHSSCIKNVDQLTAAAVLFCSVASEILPLFGACLAAAAYAHADDVHSCNVTQIVNRAVCEQ